MKHFKLSQTEFDIMLVLWECPEPIRPAQLLEKIQSTHPWSISTLQTILSRLEEKGAITVEIRKRYRYCYPSVTKEEYAAFETGSLIERLRDSSPVTLMAGLIRTGQLEESELEEIELLLQRAKEELKSKRIPALEHKKGE